MSNQELLLNACLETDISCPTCKDKIIVDVYETGEDGFPTETGFHFSCNDSIIEDSCCHSYEDVVNLNREINQWFESNRQELIESFKYKENKQ